jgi:hypothetical protein
LLRMPPRLPARLLTDTPQAFSARLSDTSTSGGTGVRQFLIRAQ